MPLTIKQANKLKAGQTAWRCIPMVARWEGDKVIVQVEEVLLQGKKTRGVAHATGSFRFLGVRDKVPAGQYARLRGEYYTGDLCGWNVAKTFLSRRKAMRFKEEVESGQIPQVEANARERDREDRAWDAMFDYSDIYDSEESIHNYVA